MEKPKMKRVVAIDYKASEGYGGYWVSFFTNDSIAELAREFGEVKETPRKWILQVDRRYDFEEVVAWLESFND